MLDPVVGRDDVIKRAMQVQSDTHTHTQTYFRLIRAHACSMFSVCPMACAARRTDAHDAGGMCVCVCVCVSLNIQVLLRRSKNNVVLIGDAGVGKTAVVEAIAQVMVSQNAPKG